MLPMTDGEKQSPLGMRLHRELQEDLQQLRLMNDGMMDQDHRNWLCGRIAQLKHIIRNLYQQEAPSGPA